MELWTFAVRYVVDQWNDTPRQDLENKTPNEIFVNVKETLPKNKTGKVLRRELKAQVFKGSFGY